MHKHAPSPKKGSPKGSPIPHRPEIALPRALERRHETPRPEHWRGIQNTTIITIANSSSSSSSSSSVFFSITSWVVLRAGRLATHPQEGGAVNTCPPRPGAVNACPRHVPDWGGGRSPPGPPRDCQAGQCWTRLGRRLCSAPGGGVGGDGHRCWPWGATGAPLGPSITARKGGGSCGCDRGPKSTTPGSASQVAPCLV